MKQMIKAMLFVVAPLCLLFAGTAARAQQALKDTLTEADYNLQVPRHIVNIYSNFVPYVLFSIIAIGMLYVTYRYWADNRPESQDFNNHGLGH